MLPCVCAVCKLRFYSRPLPELEVYNAYHSIFFSPFRLEAFYPMDLIGTVVKDRSGKGLDFTIGTATNLYQEPGSTSGTPQCGVRRACKYDDGHISLDGTSYLTIVPPTYPWIAFNSFAICAWFNIRDQLLKTTLWFAGRTNGLPGELSTYRMHAMPRHLIVDAEIFTSAILIVLLQCLLSTIQPPVNCSGILKRALESPRLSALHTIPVDGQSISTASVSPSSNHHLTHCSLHIYRYLQGSLLLDHQ